MVNALFVGLIFTMQKNTYRKKQCRKCKKEIKINDFVDIFGDFNERGHYCISCYEKNEKEIEEEIQTQIEKLKTWYGKDWQHNALPGDFTYILSKERDFCPYCGKELWSYKDKNGEFVEIVSHLEHMDPLDLGGEDSIRNTLYSCKSCNLKKGSKPFTEWVKQLEPKYRDISTQIYVEKHGHLPEEFQIGTPTARSDMLMFTGVLDDEDLLDYFPPVKADDSHNKHEIKITAKLPSYMVEGTKPPEGTIKKETPPTNAIRGTYDESYFINPKTGGFCFPKYKHDKRFIIKIIDETDYREEKSMIFSWLDSDERKNFDIFDFENEFCNMFTCIYAEPFYELFNKNNSSHLKPYEYLKGCGEELLDIINEHKLERTRYGFQYLLADKPFLKKLLAGECLSLYKFENEHERNKYIKDTLLLSFNAPDLKEFCRKLGLKSSLSKSKLADQLIDSKVPLKLPEAVVLNEKFHNMMGHFVNVYIEDIMANLERFHPLYIPVVWETMVDDEDYSFVKQKAKNILESKYWEKRLQKRKR